MDILEALYIAKHSPTDIAEKMRSFLIGYSGRRKASYFDMFLFYPLYSYRPAYDFFSAGTKLGQNYQMNYFIDKTNKRPEIFASFQNDFYETLQYTKEAILYGQSSNIFVIDNDMCIKLIKKQVASKDTVAENIGKLFSTQNTAYLYKFFKVDINAI